jgi:hypothetical protein
MVALFDMALGLGCSCCIGPMPGEADVPDIVCHQCKKVLYSSRAEMQPPLDMEPRA